MKKKLLRWLIYVVCALLALAIAGILLIDTIAKSVAERRVRAETGMDVEIGKFTIGLRSSTIHIENFVLKNPAEFGGDTFVEIPELFFDYDREALRSGRLQLNLVRINIAKIHVVENSAGKKNIDELQKRQRNTGTPRSSPAKPTHGSTNEIEPQFVFDGIETLDVTLKTVRFTSFKNPNQNLEHDLGIRNEIFKNLKTDKDFQTAAALLALKAGASLWLSGELANPMTLLFGGSAAGKETKNILEGLVEPMPKKSRSKPTP